MQQDNDLEIATTKRISIYINDEVKEIYAHSTLQCVIEAYCVTRGVDIKAIAAAVNRELAPRDNWQTTPCKTDDKLELFSVVAGG
ncbi:sulfur carrier protein ThiS [Shewanella sp. 125m-7]